MSRDDEGRVANVGRCIGVPRPDLRLEIKHSEKRGLGAGIWAVGGGDIAAAPKLCT
jgi:hypothetical protein